MRDRDPLYDLCRSLPGVTEDVKWQHDLVFSVGGKMFAAFALPEGEPFGLPVDPDLCAALTREPGIVPAPYLAKHGWVSVERRSALPLATTRDLLREAHARVAAKLPRRVREELGVAAGPDATRRKT
jgi:predicted DNA-binding protein (MmcQ/YjbR family)